MRGVKNSPEEKEEEDSRESPFRATAVFSLPPLLSSKSISFFLLSLSPYHFFPSAISVERVPQGARN